MAIERTIVNIYLSALERSITGDLISMIRFMPESDSRLEIIGANIYQMDKDFAIDFCNTFTPKKDPEEKIIQENFKDFTCSESTYDKKKYNYKRIFSLVLEGENAISKMTKVLGDIRIRNGTTILGRYGFYQTSKDNNIIAEFPASTSTNKEEADAQIDLMWNKYKNRGGPLKNSIVYPNNSLNEVGNSLVIVKPNTFESTYDPRIGDVINAISMTGMAIIGAKIQIPTKEQMEQFYIVHKGKPFYNNLINFMSGKKSLALLYEGIDACKKIREAALSIIRHAYSDSILENTIHTSDSKEDFHREVKVVNFSENNLS
ncbi:MAG: nucleoside-diphosphate kinase [bacterium]|nr:nucleoside-diphosphate kinase [bacterium]